MKGVKLIALMMVSAVTTVVTLLGLMFWFNLEIVERSPDGGAVVNNDHPRSVGAVREIVSQEEAQMEAIEAVEEAIVGVVSTVENQGGFLGVFGGQTTGSGSGVVYDVRNGNTYIVTNEHVVDGATNIEVVFNDDDQTRLDATLVGADVYTDIAVLKVESFEATVVAEFGYTEDLRLGQTVIALGNPLGLEFAGSATMGVVSGHDRSVSIPIMSTNGHYQNWSMTVLQTDAAINPGNSGGALINLAGEVVGINSMKIAQAQVEGMSFSIPTYILLPIIQDLETYGEVKRPLLGVSLVNLNLVPSHVREEINLSDEIVNGVLVNEVVELSIADEMGIEPGDVITYIGDVEITDFTSFRQALFTYREGDLLTLTIIREGVELELSIVVVMTSGFIQ